MSNVQETAAAREALSVYEFCARYGVGLTTAYKEIREKRLSIRKVGRPTLIPVCEAERWFAAPVASPARKLGVSPSARALIIGSINLNELPNSLRCCIAESVEEAMASLSIVTSLHELHQAARVHQTLCGDLPFWVIYERSQGAAFGEMEVRRAMQDLRFVDMKSYRLTKSLSGTHYRKRRQERVANM